MEKGPSLRVALLRAVRLPALVMMILLLVLILISAVLIREEINNRQFLIVHMLSHQWDAFLGETERLLNTLANGMKGLSLAEQQALLDQSRVQYRRFTALYRVDSDGWVQVESTVHSSQLGVDLSDTEYFRRARDSGQAYFSDPFFSSVDGSVVLDVAVPIFTGGRFRGAVIGELSVVQLQQMFEASQTLGDGTTAFIVDREGRLIVHPNLQWVREQRNLGDWAVIQTARGGQDAFELFPAGNPPEWLVGSAMPMDAGWVVVTVQPLLVAARSLFILMIGSLVIFVLSLGLFWGVQEYSLRQITRPLTAFIQSVDALAHGEYATAFPDPYSGAFAEIAILADRFQRMREAIQMHIQALIQANERLEREIEERRAVEAALRISEQHFREVVEHIREAFWMFDWETRQVVYVSPASEEIWKRPRFALYGGLEGWRESVHPEDRQAAEDGLLRIVTDERAVTREYRIVRPDGEIRWVLDRGFAIRDEAGQVRRIVGIAEDITERRQAEEELRRHRDHLEDLVRARTVELIAAKEQAETASHAKSIFLANVSHELRTPLNAILGFAQLMRRDPALTAQQCDYLEIINRSGEHLLALINDVLDLSKIEAGRMSLNPVSFDLFQLLADLTEMFRARMDAKGLAFIVDAAPDLPRYVMADRNKLIQVLINLLGNAVKFTAEGRVSLRVTAGLSAESCLAPAEAGNQSQCFLQFEVADTGPGISPEEQSQLFMPFEQTTTGRQAQTGTGLGLSISQHYVRLMGGEIQVRSSEGPGVIFTFTIPVMPAVEAIEGSSIPLYTRHFLVPGQSAPEGGPYRMLVVDDEPDNRRLLMDLLHELDRSCGPSDASRCSPAATFELREAASGEEALQIWEAWHPHMIWLDNQLPGISGVEVVRQIRSRPAVNATVVIAVTASGREQDRAQFLAAGYDDFLRKPFNEAAVTGMLSQHLGLQFTERETAGRMLQEKPGIPELESLAVLPSDLFDELRKVISAGYLSQLLEQLGRVAEYDRTLAAALRELAERYDYETLFKLFQLGPNAVGTPHG